MSVHTEKLNPTLCKDINRTAGRLLTRQGFRDNPYGALNVGLLTFEFHRAQLPIIDDGTQVGYVFEAHGAAMSKEMAAVWSVITAKMRAPVQPFAMIEEGEDAQVKPFMEVRPRPDAPANSNATSAEFRFHTDNAVLPAWLRPRWISLACLVNEANAATGLVSVEALSDGLPITLQQAARQCRFVCAAPPSFGAEAFSESEPRPLLFDMPDGVHAAFPTYRTRPFDPDDEVAVEVLREIERLANEQATWVNLQPGQILQFDNARAMHSRKPINGERLLLRAYWRDGLHELDRHAETDLAYFFSAKRALCTARSSK